MLLYRRHFYHMFNCLQSSEFDIKNKNKKYKKTSGKVIQHKKDIYRERVLDTV